MAMTSPPNRFRDIAAGWLHLAAPQAEHSVRSGKDSRSGNQLAGPGGTGSHIVGSGSFGTDYPEQVSDQLEPSECWRDPLSDALLPVAAVVCFGMLALSLAGSLDGNFVAPQANKLIQSLRECTGIAQDAARLSCFDRAFSTTHPARGANAPALDPRRP
jgi:hypothetical protein